MSDDFPRVLAMKIDRLLDMVSAGTVQPDALELLQVAYTLRQHGELLRAERCEAVARRMMPLLQRGGGVQS